MYFHIDPSVIRVIRGSKKSIICIFIYIRLLFVLLALFVVQNITKNYIDTRHKFPEVPESITITNWNN